jgi:hypothetical protein
MQTQPKLGMIAKELKGHAPFTLFGAAMGILCMLLFKNAGSEVNHQLFLVFHPTHVVLSAIVTASLFKLYKGNKGGFLVILIVGYFGSIGVATLSDCILPFFGESILGVAIPEHKHEETDSHVNEEQHTTDNSEHGAGQDANSQDNHTDHEHPPALESGETKMNNRAKLHLGFIEDWYLVNPAALLGIIIAYLWPQTKFPHAGHVLISTWASSFHVLMNTHRELSLVMLIGVFIVLFIAVWLPCCISDIVFPLLFVKSTDDLSCFHHH